MKESRTKCFIINSEITTNLAMGLTIFFAKCKLKKENALLIIDSDGGNMEAVDQIVEAYKASGVYLITIGAGTLNNCTSALFCMGDERILLPNTSFMLHNDFLKYFCPKTKITEELFAQKKVGKLWRISDEEYEKYGITTRNPEGWFDIVVEAMKNDKRKYGDYICFEGEFNNRTAIEVVRYFVECKLNGIKKATIIINSPGGEVQQLSFILEAYKESQLHLTVLGVGQVASCGSCLFCMGDERILLPNTRFLIHYPSSKANGKLLLEEIEGNYVGIRRCNKYIFELLSKKTKITKHIYTKKCKNSVDWILSDKEIQKYNITTKDSSEWMNVLTEVVSQSNDKEEV